MELYDPLFDIQVRGDLYRRPSGSIHQRLGRRAQAFGVIHRHPALTAERVAAFDVASTIDLTGKKLAAVVNSSGAEYLDEIHLPYQPYKDLPAALNAVASRQSTVVVNSVGALQYFISRRYSKELEMPRGILSPALMAIALPPRSPLKKAIDRALIRITSGADWRAVEDRFFQR